MIPVKASGWFDTDLTNEERKKLTHSGLIPVNDIFFDLWGNSNAINLLFGGYGCFEASQLIVTNDGSKPISQIKVGDSVLSYSGEKAEYKTVTEIFKHNNTSDCYEIELINGKRIRATENHKFYYGGLWVSLKDLLYLFYGNLENNTELLKVSSIEYGFDKNIQLEKYWQRKNNEASINRRLFTNSFNKRQWRIRNCKGSQNYLHDVLWHTRNAHDCQSHKQNKNGQQSGKFGVDDAKRELFGCVQCRTILHSNRGIPLQRKINRKGSKRNKRKIQAKNIYTCNACKRIWSKAMHDKGYYSSQELEAHLIKSVKKIKLPVVYDISVKDNHNFYLDCGNKILVHNSGKSVFIQTYLLHLCQTVPNFKCFFGRKVFEDVRPSVHSKFVTLIEDLGLTGFSYSKQNNGTMIITHKSGGKFIPFGASKADGLKSIDDPTHFFLEEMDQFTLDDFGVILSRLRTKKTKTQLYGAFNTAKVLQDHWIRKIFFTEETSQLEYAEQQLVDVVNEIGVYKLFCNYTDNYFIDQKDYYNKLVIAAGGDLDALEASAKGAWGSYKPVNVFATQYNASKHESVTAVFRPHIPIIFIFDFNLNPFSVNMAQMWSDKEGEHCHVFSEMGIKAGSIPEICDRIKLQYGNYLPSCIVTGDAMGKRGEISQRDNASNYKQIQKGLGLRETQFKIPSNPLHEASRNDVNYVLAHFPDFKINPSTCPNTCRDMRIVECDAFGSIIKRNRNKVSELSDHLDNIRYLVNTMLKGWVLNHQKRK